MAPNERRSAIVAATLPLLREHGRAVSTKQIAEAAGVAEGTIFRVFESKAELVDTAIRQAFSNEELLAQLARVDRDLPLRPRLVAMVTLVQERLRSVFGLMQAVGAVGPPDHDSRRAVEARERTNAALRRLVAADAHRLSVPSERMLHLLYLLTFAGSHHHISDGALLTPHEIVAVVLDGILKEAPPCSSACCANV